MTDDQRIDMLGLLTLFEGATQSCYQQPERLGLLIGLLCQVGSVPLEFRYDVAQVDWLIWTVAVPGIDEVILINRAACDGNFSPVFATDKAVALFLT
ncbi:hypothetical protein KSC_011960 [Ktedonobacter sp. SOSP1-52]|nr:hypothetical protein KSC_011960 [Ktedonobacter sp. SOSP1-52]